MATRFCNRLDLKGLHRNFFGSVIPSLTYITMATTATPIAGSSKPHPPITILKRARADVPLSQTKFLKKTAKGKVLSCMSDSYRLCCH